MSLAVHYPVCTKKEYKWFKVYLLCDRLGRHVKVEIKSSNGSPTNLLRHLNTANKRHKKTSRNDGDSLSP